MANLRISSWFFPLLIVLTVAGMRPADAKPRDLSSYNLRVHIFQSNWDPRQGSYAGGQGSGLANLMEGQDVHGIDFSYSCPINYMKSVGSQAYAAKWKKPGKTIEVVGNAIGNDNKSDACEFKITIHDYVYDVQNGTLSEFTQEQYKVRIGAALPKSGPIDSDVSHYPLRLTILAIDWTPLVNGTRTGTGRGNLMSADGLSSVDFTTNCIVTLKVSEQGRSFAGQWAKEGSSLTILLRTAGQSATSYTCALQTNLHTDIYVKDASGTIKAISAEEYRRTVLKVTPAAAPAVHDAPRPGDGTGGEAKGTGEAAVVAQTVPAGLPNGGSSGGTPIDRTGKPEIVTEPGQQNRGSGGGSSAGSPQSVALYRRACDGGSAIGCRNLAIMYAQGTGVTQSYAVAVPLYRKACDKGDAGSCSNLGLLYMNGTGLTQDYAQAVTLYRKACDAEDSSACNNLALMLEHGTGVAQDSTQAAALYRKACDGGVAASCGNLGVMYAKGDGVARDYGKAEALDRKACDAGLFGPCVNLGILYEDGTGVPRDHAQAKSLFRKACDGGVAVGCNNLGVMLENEKGTPGPPQ